MKKIFLLLVSFYLVAALLLSHVKAAPVLLRIAFEDTFQIPKTDVLNVKDFGALGDNVHDDGVAIQKALDKAATMSGATVYFPDGIYMVQDPGNGDSGHGKFGLRAGSNTTLQLSAGAVLHKKGNDEILSNKDWVNGNTNITITGGTFKTDSGAGEKWAPTRTGIKLVNVSNSKVSGCHFAHIGNSAISIEKKSTRNVVSNCTFTDVFNCAIELNGSRNTARKNYLHDMGSDGILVNGNNCIVSANRLVNIGKYSAPSLGSGISLGVDNHTCSGNKILNNVITGGAAHGIINDRSANTLIEGNRIINTGSAGIKVGGGGKGSTVSKNIIKNTGLSKDLKGVYVHTGVVVDGDNVTIADNTLSNVTGTGIYINTGSNNTVVKRCRVTTTKPSPQSEVESTAIQVKAESVKVTGITAKKTTYHIPKPGGQ